MQIGAEHLVDRSAPDGVEGLDRASDLDGELAMRGRAKLVRKMLRVDAQIAPKSAKLHGHRMHPRNLIGRGRPWRDDIEANDRTDPGR